MRPSIKPSRSFSPKACINVILLSPKMSGTSQFQSSCIGQARISDHRVVIIMATIEMAEKDITDSVVYCVLMVLIHDIVLAK